MGTPAEFLASREPLVRAFADRKAAAYAAEHGIDALAAQAAADTTPTASTT